MFGILHPTQQEIQGYRSSIFRTDHNETFPFISLQKMLFNYTLHV